MKKAILLHGKPGKEEYYNPRFPSPSNYHWIPWLQKQLIVHGIKADTPEVPKAYDPKWQLWVKEVERFDIDPNTMLVGHSCGGGFWVRYLSEHKDLKVDKVVLVAPSLGLSWNDKTFFNFTIDPDIVKRTKDIVVIYANNDKESTLEALEILKKEVPGIKVKELPGMGHFTHEDMSSSEFPQLLEELLA